MAKMNLISDLLKLNNHNFSKAERLLVEAKLFTSIYKDLMDVFQYPYKSYLKLIKYDTKEQQSMLCMNFPQEVIKDILSTEEYSLLGIAIHTNIPEEVVFEIASGINSNPTFESSIKLFELHTTVRRNLYEMIIEKIIAEYLEKREKNSSVKISNNEVFA